MRGVTEEPVGTEVPLRPRTTAKASRVAEVIEIPGMEAKECWCSLMR